MNDEIEIMIIDTEDIKEFFFKQLIQAGFSPDEEELEVLADIVFDYLIDIGMIEDFEEED